MLGEEAARAEVEVIMKQVDTDNSGYVDYTEFISAAMSKQKLLNKKNLTSAFNAFDKDGSGSISAAEIREVLGDVNPE
jgi:calcium-dependent protein kinase